MVSPGGTITTVAGTGVAGYSGDNGPATSAQLSFPCAVAVDTGGNLYVADGQRIRMISGGTITTVAGTGVSGYSGDDGPATSARLFNPTGVAVDTAGNLFIADANNYRVRKVSALGTITTVAGTGTVGYSGDNGPATSAQINYPVGVAVDAAGNLYIAELYNHVIRKVSASGTITTVAGTGVAGYSGENGPAASAQLNKPSDVAVDTAGNLYIADYQNYRVRKVSAAGTITTVAGSGSPGFVGDNGPATSAALGYVSGLAVDGTGHLYFTDQWFNTVREVTLP
jgi:sugar lactone lactonase YvrE